MIKNFNNQLNENCILFFCNQHCFPCELLEKELNEIDFLIYKVDIDKYLSFAREKNVTSIPSLYFIKNNEIIYKCNGVRSKKDILRILQHFYK